MNDNNESRIATVNEIDPEEKQASQYRTGRTEISSVTTTSRQRSQSPLLNIRSMRAVVPVTNSESANSNGLNGASVTELELKEITQTMNSALGALSVEYCVLTLLHIR